MMAWVGTALRAAVVASAVASGCGGERAVALDVDLESDGERLCVAASHPALASPLRFGYALGAVEPPYSLSFVAGREVADGLQLAAWTLSGLRRRGRGATSVRFPERGAVRATIGVRTCTEHPRRNRGARQGGTFAVLRSPPRVVAGDLDADGRDELFAIGEDGSLQVLDAEDPSRGSVRRTDLATLDGAASDVADLDGDCAFELVAAASTGVLVVDGASGASPAPVGPPAVDVRMGTFGPGGGPGLIVGGDAGLALVSWPTGAVDVALATSVAVLDSRMDAGLPRVVSSGPGGTRWLRVAAGAARDETERLPPELAAATGPVALADLDGEAGLDLVVGDGTRLRFGLASASSLTAREGPDLGAAIVRVVTADLDGDCLDDVVARLADGRWVAVAGLDGSAFATPSIASVDVVVGDVDGDGEHEVAVLGAGGRVTLWSP
jgi:hypothetical protein